MTVRTHSFIGLASIAPAVLATLGLTGCHDREVNRGPLVTETRDVSDFDAISVKGSTRLVVRIGDKTSVSVEGPERIVKRLTTDVDDDTLNIRNTRKEWVFGDGESRLTVTVTTPSLEELHLEGSNDVRLNGFAGGSSRIDIEGAANIVANGKLDELVVHMQGAGRANFRDLVAKEAKVTVDGVGSVHVNATESLDATMNGVGAILYSGAPRDVDTSMNGVGTISKDRDRMDKDKDDDEDASPEDEDKEAIDPDSLQPEYDEKDKPTVEKTSSGVV